MVVTGENITEAVDPLDTSSIMQQILGAAKSAASAAIRQTVDGAGAYVDYTKHFTPVYKIMITVPTLKDGAMVPYRYILADTSRPTVNFLSSHDSPILGLWVDQSDMTEPDKAIVLLQNPVTQVSNIFEQDMLQFHQFGVRNWLDIWLGYVPAIKSNIALLGSLVGLNFIDQLVDIPFTSPDPFFFGNDSHVFSGPIVSVKREVTSAGDRLQIIGFSPSMILKQTQHLDYKVKKTNALTHTVFSAIQKIADDTIPIARSMIGDDSVKNNLLMGRFPFAMFAGCGDDGKPNEVLRISPVNHDGSNPPSGSLPIWSKQFKDNDLVGGKLKKKKMRITIGGRTSLYDLLFGEITTAAYTGLGRLYGQILSSKPQTDKQLKWAFTDGEGHPGVFIKYGFAHEINSIKKMVKTNKYSQEHIRNLTLGVNCREFEGGVEYGTVFNIRQFFAKTDPLGKANILTFPFDFMNKLGATHYKDHKDLWNYLLDDIEMYGPSESPLEKWLWGEGGGAINIDTEGVADYIADSMRRTYYTGMSGSIFAVGDPTLRPTRVISVKDGRSDNLTQNVVDVMAKALRRYKVRENIVVPEMFRLKDMNKDFYIWKVRHYVGVNSGYVSKVYYTEERLRSWQKHVDSVDSLIRQALMQSRMTMGGLGAG